MTEAVFSGQGLGCMRGGRIIFQNLNFSVRPGSILHVQGGNGSGKTSLLRMMAGLLTPQAGRLSLMPCAFLPADDAVLKLQDTIISTLQFWAKFYEKTQQDINIVLDKMDIMAFRDRFVRHLSAGQKRRLNIARILLSEAPLWILDEPLGALDDNTRRLLTRILKDHCAAGGRVVLAGHDALPDMTPEVLRMGTLA